MGPDHLKAVADHMMQEATDAEKYLLQELINYLAESKLRHELIDKKLDDGFARIESHCSNRTAACGGVMKEMQDRLSTLEREGLFDSRMREALAGANDLRVEQIAQQAMDKYFTRVKTAQAVGVVSLISATLIGIGQYLLGMVKN